MKSRLRLKSLSVLLMCISFLILQNCKTKENQLPVCIITSPVDGDTLHADSMFLLCIEAFDTDGDILVANAWVDGVQHKLEGSSSYELEISPGEIGSDSCEIRAMVMDDDFAMAHDTIQVWFKEDIIPEPRPVKDVSGIFSENTLFSKDTLWHVIGNCLVEMGVELRIDPGTIISFAPNPNSEYDCYYILVKGTLIARGEEADRIVFRSDNLEDEYWGRLEFQGGVPDWNTHNEIASVVEFCEFHKGGKDGAGMEAATILTLGAYPLIKDNVFYNSYHSDVFSRREDASTGTIRILNNQFTSFVGVWDNLEYTGNSMEGLANLGLSSSYSVVIDGNRFRNTYETSAIDMNGDMSRVQIRNNDFFNCKVGIRSYNVTQAGVIKNNNFFDSGFGLLQCQTQINIDATGNYWGVDDPESIPDHVFDYYDDFVLGKVDYSSYSLEAFER
ncbi:MAG: right-handed parallel beta-helix repeat-containing protein [Bacteroides sp.]|nr:right-handed parallel beta-helix repeat-containing protein [Bacteroides sp.]